MPEKRSSPKKPATPSSQVKAYFAALPAGTRRTLKQLRDTIRAVAPGAVDHFSYGIPGYRLDDKPLVWYAAFKSHVSLYPIGTALRKEHAAALEGYETSKGTVRFPLDEPLPVPLVKRLVKGRMAEARRQG
jgi:uncharacterized protein YdhG (YjbR/CyaY superfamily)